MSCVTLNSKRQGIAQKMSNAQLTSFGQHGPVIQRVAKLNDAGAEAFVVIDSCLGGGGTGGIRMSESVTLDEIADLAHEMTLKFAWLNIPRGGAKSGIRHQGELSEELKKKLLNEYGEFVSDLLLSREYVAGMDLGIGPEDMAIVMNSAGFQPDSSSQETDINSSFFTALTVFVSLKTLLLQRGRTLSNATILIEGVGKVSAHLMRMVSAAGASVVGASTIVGSIYDPDGIDIDELLRLKKKYDDDCVKHYPLTLVRTPEELYLYSADVLVPGAQRHSIHEGNIERIKARFVVPIANIPASLRSEKMLHDRGIDYLPGFVSNSGGIFCWYLARLSRQARENIIRDGLARKIHGVIVDAKRGNLSIAELARKQAEQNADRMRLENSTFFHRAIGIARKLAPRRIVYVVLIKIFGNRRMREDSVFCRWYFDAKYFR